MPDRQPLSLLRRPGDSGSDWLAVVAFLIPTFVWMEVTIVGRIFIPELLLIGLLPFLLMMRGHILAAPLPRTFLILAALWLGAQVLTDLIRASDFRDYSRGWSKIVFTTLNFCALYLLLYGRRQRIVLFALGLAIGGYLSFLLNPSVFAQGQPWKFGLGFATILIVTLSSQWRPIFRVRFLPALLLFLLGAYSIAVGSRNLAGITFLTSFYVLIQQIVGRRSRPPTRSPARALLFFVAGIMAAAVLLQAYAFAASQGYLGERAQRIYERQGSGSLGVLLGGRPEILASSRAILDSPIIGHGSWARDPGDVYILRILDLGRFGYDPSLSDTELIPTHSHLTGGWVEAGIMGAIFWLWILLLIVRVLSKLYMVRESLGPMIAFLGFVTLWDILFSPFGADRRITVPYNVVLMMFVWDSLRVRVPRNVIGGVRLALHRRRRPVDTPTRYPPQ